MSGYIAGGYTGSYRTELEKYDDTEDTWTLKTSMTTGRTETRSFSVAGYGYVIGGYNGTDVTEKYDATTDTWTTKQIMTSGRYGHVGFSLNNYGYSLTGNWASYLKSIEKYDYAANTWTPKTNASYGRYLAFGFSLNNYGYIGGGYGTLNPPFGASHLLTTERYDDSADSWSPKADINSAGYGHSGFSLNGFGYTTGGGASAGSKVVEKYNDIANTWTPKTNLTDAVRYHTTFAYNNFGYISGGEGTGATYRYNDLLDTWTPRASLNIAREGLAGFEFEPIVISETTKSIVIGNISKLGYTKKGAFINRPSGKGASFT